MRIHCYILACVILIACTFSCLAANFDHWWPWIYKYCKWVQANTNALSVSTNLWRTNAFEDIYTEYRRVGVGIDLPQVRLDVRGQASVMTNFFVRSATTEHLRTIYYVPDPTADPDATPGSARMQNWYYTPSDPHPSYPGKYYTGWSFMLRGASGWQSGASSRTDWGSPTNFAFELTDTRADTIRTIGNDPTTGNWTYDIGGAGKLADSGSGRISFANHTNVAYPRIVFFPDGNVMMYDHYTNGLVTIGTTGGDGTSNLRIEADGSRVQVNDILDMLFNTVTNADLIAALNFIGNNFSGSNFVGTSFSGSNFVGNSFSGDGAGLSNVTASAIEGDPGIGIWGMRNNQVVPLDTVLSTNAGFWKMQGGQIVTELADASYDMFWATNVGGQLILKDLP